MFSDFPPKLDAVSQFDSNYDFDDSHNKMDTLLPDTPEKIPKLKLSNLESLHKSPKKKKVKKKFMHFFK